MALTVISESKCLISAGWDDVPHLDEAAKRKMLAETPPHLRDARSKGIPSLGSGAIFPIAESEFVCAPFKIPPHFVRGYGMDVGWKKTSAAFLAWDRENDIVYVISEHYRGQAEPATHAAAIKARGIWLPGFIDPASRQRGQKDGDQLLALYQGLGLKLNVADNGVDAGLHEMYLRLATGRMKVFSTCVNWLMEYRLYRRDEHGKIIKKNDHLMDATRYGSRTSSLVRFSVAPMPSVLVGTVAQNLYNQ